MSKRFVGCFPISMRIVLPCIAVPSFDFAFLSAIAFARCEGTVSEVGDIERHGVKGP